MNGFPIITVLTLVPLIGGLMLLGVDSRQRNLARFLSFVFSLISLALAILLWKNFDPASGEIQFAERHEWIPTLGVDYFVGVDGLGLLMVLLTAIVTPMAMLVAGGMFKSAPHPVPLPIRWGEGGVSPGEGTSRNPQLYFSLMLFLQAGLFGTFTALNFFHWFIFWELSLVPAFFLIKLWGGPQRTPAALQFFVYTMVGSIAMLLAFLAIGYATGTFDFIRLAELGRNGQISSALIAKIAGWNFLNREQFPIVIFLGVFLGFAVKVPVIPFHTWLPTAYTEAPTSTTMLLTGVMSKMGVYGLLRILMPLFPEQMRAILTPLLWLAVATIILSAYAAFAQRDLKRMFAYSSINHLGYCLLGVFAVMKYTQPSLGSSGAAALDTEKAAALNGVLLQMFNHGLTAAALFAFVGFLEQRSGGLRGLNDFGGIRKVAPVFCGLMGISTFASLGLPGLNGFVGEFLIFKGSFPLATWATALATLGLLATAIFLLTFLQRVWNGPLNEKWSGLADLSYAERLIVLPATALMFVIGLWPQLILQFTNATVAQMVEQLKF